MERTNSPGPIVKLPSTPIMSSSIPSTTSSSSSSNNNNYPAPKVGPLRLGNPMDSIRFPPTSPSNSSTTSNGNNNNTNRDGSRSENLGLVQTTEVLEELTRKKQVWGENYEMSEDSIRNDYSENYVKTGERPQNNLRGTKLEERFVEYPKLESLLQLKHTLLSSPLHSIPPTYHLTPTPSTSLPLLPLARFDVILLTPPPSTSFVELQSLDLATVASTPGFIWLWVGSGVKGDGVGLEAGRELLAGWGYRRCEDVVWLKTNRGTEEDELNEVPEDSLLKPTIEHCLMGIRGTVRRSTDPWFVHCNVDTDVIVWEGDKTDPQLKPPELQTLIENFCQGTRRLHLYGSPNSLRRGWLTVGTEFTTPPISSLPLSTSFDDETSTPSPPTPIVVHPVEKESPKSPWIPVPYDKEDYLRLFSGKGFGVVKIRKELNVRMGELDLTGRDDEDDEDNDEDEEENEADRAVEVLLPFMEELEALRPKSPPPRDGALSSGGLGRGRGAGLGVTRSLMVNGANGGGGGGNLNNLGGRSSNLGKSGLGGGRYSPGISGGSRLGGNLNNGSRGPSGYNNYQQQNQNQQQPGFNGGNSNYGGGGGGSPYQSYTPYNPQSTSSRSQQQSQNQQHHLQQQQHQQRQQYQQQQQQQQSASSNYSSYSNSSNSSNSNSNSGYSNYPSSPNQNQNQNQRRQQQQSSPQSSNGGNSTYRQQQLNQAHHRPSSQLQLQQQQQYYQQLQLAQQQQQILLSQAVVHSQLAQQAQNQLAHQQQQQQQSPLISNQSRSPYAGLSHNFSYSPSPSSPSPSTSSLPTSDSFSTVDLSSNSSPQTPDIYSNWLSSAGRRPSEMGLPISGMMRWGSIDETGRRQSQIGLPLNGASGGYEYEYEYELEQREREEGGGRRESVAYGGMGPSGMGMGMSGFGFNYGEQHGQFENIQEDISQDQ